MNADKFIDPIQLQELLSKPKQQQNDSKKNDSNNKGKQTLQHKNIQYLHSYGNNIAMIDLQGRMAHNGVEIDFYNDQLSFVCQGCFLEAKGLCLSFPLHSEKDMKTGKTIYVVNGKFGSVPCMLRWAMDRKYTFYKESGGLLFQMLIHAYQLDINKYDLSEIEKLPQCPAYTSFPQFCSPLIYNDDKKDNKKDNTFDFSFGATGPTHRDVVSTKNIIKGEERSHIVPTSGEELHKQFYIPLQIPDPKKIKIVSDHTALLIALNFDSQRSQISLQEIQKWFPHFFVKTK